MITDSINHTLAALNTLHASRWTLFKAGWFGKKTIAVDTLDGYILEFRTYKSKTYMVGRRRPQKSWTFSFR